MLACPHDAGGQVQEPRELRQVDLGRPTSAVPASTATAGALVVGSSRGSSTRGSVSA